MGRNRLAIRLCSDSSSYDSSSDSSEDEPQLLLLRYQDAHISYGLSQRSMRLAALTELQLIFDEGLYSSSDKKVQQAVFDDLLVAAQQRDSRAGVRQAVSTLLSTAKRVLPQKQRQQLAKAEKQAAVAASRAARKEGAGGASSPSAAAAAADSDSEEECQVVFSDVPLEAVSVILQFLDPISLAAAACVCRSWYQLATCDDCWGIYLGTIFPLTFRRNPAAQRWFQQTQRQQQQQQQQQSPPQSQPQPQQPQGCSSLPAEASASALSEATHSTGNGAVGPGAIYTRFCSKARKHPSDLVVYKACRELLMPQSRLVWCVPRSAPEPATTHAVSGSTSPPQGRRQVHKAAAAAAAVAGAGHVAGPSSTKQPPGQMAGAPADGMAHHLTAAQAVKWMMGFNGRAVFGDWPPCRNSDSDWYLSDAGSSSSSGDDSDGEESHTAAQKALRLWSIGKQ